MKLYFCTYAGDIKFVSAEYRLFKVLSKKSGSSKVTYTGGMLGAENQFDFDHQRKFKVRIRHVKYWLLVQGIKLKNLDLLFDTNKWQILFGGMIPIPTLNATVC